GGLRQAGILAAAGLYALEHNVARLREDHDNAVWLEQQLRQIGVEIAAPGAQTNVLYLRQPPALAAKFGPWMRERGVLISSGPLTRILTHLDVSRQDLQRVVELWREFLQQHA
ncbi:beta-eliminating lyase-related protein, partial [Serratia marcescens]